MVISFSSGYWAEQWLKETESEFLLLVDEERLAYKKYDMEYSMVRAWGIKNLWHYAQLLWAGKRLSKIKGDTGQMGGDFVVDSGGIIRLTHRSHDPTDRPEVETLLKVLREF